MIHPEKMIDPFLATQKAPPQSLLKFLRWALQGSGHAILLATVFSVIAGGIEAATAWILGRVIDSAQTKGPEVFFSLTNLPLVISAVAFFLLARPLFNGLASGINAIIIQPNIFALVMQRLNRWTMGQSITYFDNDFAGRIAQKQMQTARASTEVVVEMINVVAFALASVVGAAALVMGINGWLGVILVLWMIGYCLLIRLFIPKVRGRAGRRAAARAMVTGQIVDTVTNVKTVKLFAHADHEERASMDALSGYRTAALEFGYVSAWFRFCLLLIGGLLPILLVGGALIFWAQGTASVGDIVAAGAVSVRLAQMTGWVSFSLMGIYANIGEVEDGIRTLATPMRLLDEPGAGALSVPNGAIRFEGVSFAYGQKKGGIRGVNLEIAPGEKIGIVGASGAGKSTLVSLLLRLYDTEGGRVLIDGQDVAKVTQDSLRRQIALVTQDTAMFNRSARENILYGRPDASDADLFAAARQAEADHFIRDLTDLQGNAGYDARLGERGVKLSGGQRQRIALARAILKDAPILVLDEATSALDSEVEAQIQLALERVMQGKTVLAIAHRLSTIANMDRIAVLEAGQIVELGSHDELLARDGVYARYWARQSGGFLNLDQDDGTGAE
jgi:ATP-binding cassette, subfamily B, bacterial